MEVGMRRLVLTLLAAATLLAADNPWLTVQQLPNRSELRIYQRGVKDPITATLADANEERIVVVAKNKQVAIQREEIDRLDARPMTPTKKPEVTKTEKETAPDYTPTPPAKPPVPGTSSSSSVSFGGNKPDFKTIYTRPR
jgi:hypothetical protein